MALKDQVRDPTQTAKLLSKEQMRLQALLDEQDALEAEVTVVDDLLADAQAYGTSTTELEHRRTHLGQRAARLAQQIEQQRQRQEVAKRENSLAQYEALLKRLYGLHQKYRGLVAEIDEIIGKHTRKVRNLDTQADELLSHLSTLGNEATALAQMLSQACGVSDEELRALDEKYRCE
jgi:chromosome segregation ATPase